MDEKNAAAIKVNYKMSRWCIYDGDLRRGQVIDIRPDFHGDVAIVAMRCGCRPVWMRDVFATKDDALAQLRARKVDA